jgi:hypothetical protein
MGRVGWLGDSPTGDGRPFVRTGGETWGRRDTKFVIYASAFWTPHQSLSRRELPCLLTPTARRIWNLEGKISALDVRRVSRGGGSGGGGVDLANLADGVVGLAVWQGEGSERKGRFVINFARQCRHWPKGSVKMETLPGLALNMLKWDYLTNWDVKSWYRHFRMRDYFLFIWRACLQVYCVAVRIGKVGAAVYEADAASCQVSTERVGVPSAPVDR